MTDGNHFEFGRGIDDDFVKRLNDEYEQGGWWRAIASDANLFVAIRQNYINVYWNGASLLKLFHRGGQLIGEIHYKYLLRPEMQGDYIAVKDGKIEVENPAAMLQTDLSDIPALKKAASVYSVEEKIGVHKIVLSNPNIVDVEVTFGVVDEGNGSRSTKRIDFTALRAAAGGAELAFYEAKLFTNAAIRKDKENMPDVINQINGYGDNLREHEGALVTSYRRVCGNLTNLLGVQDRYAPARELMRKLANSEAPLHVDNRVRLVIFGFDEDQNNGAKWGPHKKKLQDLLQDQLLLIGNPKGFTRGISSPK